MLNISFSGNVWKLELDNNVVQLHLYKVDQCKPLQTDNVNSTLMLNKTPISTLKPSNLTNCIVFSEENVGSLSTLTQFLQHHVTMIILGAVTGDHSNDEFFKKLATHICGYFTIPQESDIQIPFADGEWFKKDGPTYVLYAKRMMRNGRTYTSRIRQTCLPGRFDQPHFISGEIDPIRTFHLASVIEDTDNPQPITDCKDGSFPAPFAIAG